MVVSVNFFQNKISRNKSQTDKIYPSDNPMSFINLTCQVNCLTLFIYTKAHGGGGGGHGGGHGGGGGGHGHGHGGRWL